MFGPGKASGLWAGVDGVYRTLKALFNSSTKRELGLFFRLLLLVWLLLANAFALTFLWCLTLL